MPTNTRREEITKESEEEDRELNPKNRSRE